MTRKEEIEQASNLVFKIKLCPRMAFIRGAEWADKHPRKGLWDAEKVIEWIKNNFSCSGHGFPLHYLHVSYQPEDIIRDL